MMEVLEKGRGKGYMKRTYPRLHYEDMWSPYEKCKTIVKHEWKEQCCWNSSNPAEIFMKKSKETLAELKLWSNGEFNGRKKKLEKLVNKLESMKKDYYHFESGDELKRVENQIDNILADEEMFWKQRSRAVWLKEGDRNTKYFHAKALARRKKNKIHGIEDENGDWNKDVEEVERLFGEYFTNIFTTSSPSPTQLNAALEAVPVKVSGEMNSQLDQLFTKEEIVETLAQMCPTKAPGPDGLPVAFFQKHWSSVNEGVVSTCLHILNEGGNLTLLNQTFIALVPKVSKLRKVTELRPISLCNVIYRIVEKQ